MKTVKHAVSILSILLITTLMIPCSLYGYSVRAEDEEEAVKHASDLEEFIDATEAADDAVITIEKEDGGEELIEELESQGLYTMSDEDEEYIEAFSIYGTRRILVKMPLDSLEGAKEGVSYGGDTLLSYDTVAETKEAYEQLCLKYGSENVILDLPLFSAETAGTPVGWGVDYMNLDDEMRREVKTHGQNLRTVKAAVIDSGARETHEIFGGKTITADSKSFMGSSDTIADENGHGTEVAGILAESTPDNVQLMILKVYGSDGNAISLINVSQAIQYASENGADIINLSMATTLDKPLDQYSEDVQKSFSEMDLQLKKASEKGIIICAASGNVGKDIADIYSFPAISDYTLAVGSVDKSGNRSEFSNYGDTLDFCAPGQELVTASKEGDTLYNALIQDSGTSLATPYIAACCAYLKMLDSAVDKAGALTALQETSVDYGVEGWDPFYGWGMPRYEDFIEEPVDPAPDTPDSPDSGKAASDAKAKSVKTVTVNTATVNASVIDQAVRAAGGSKLYVTKIVLGSRVKRIKSRVFSKCASVTELELRTKRLTKKSVKNALKGSKVKTVRVKVSKKAKVNRKYLAKYKKFFSKKNVGKKVKVKR